MKIFEITSKMAVVIADSVCSSAWPAHERAFEFCFEFCILNFDYSGTSRTMRSSVATGLPRPSRLFVHR